MHSIKLLNGARAFQFGVKSLALSACEGCRDLKTQNLFEPVVRITTWAALVGFLLAMPGFFLPWYVTGLLCFYFPIVWLLWLGCVFYFKSGNNIFTLLRLWFLIDLGILFMKLSITSSLGDVTHSQGSDILELITYAPVLLPISIFFQITGMGSSIPIDQIDASLTHWLIGSFGATTKEWILVSFIAALQSLLYLMFFATVRSTCKLLTCRSSGKPSASPEL
ncbi:MAG: hypothetical protein H7240_02455 [Glaciimonas sp.]|nr:hypothetical protein [Glaciimonas sp.]